MRDSCHSQTQHRQGSSLHRTAKFSHEEESQHSSQRAIVYSLSFVTPEGFVFWSSGRIEKALAVGGTTYWELCLFIRALRARPSMPNQVGGLKKGPEYLGLLS